VSVAPRTEAADALHRAELAGLLQRVRPVDVVEAAHLAEAARWARSGAPLWRVGHPGDPSGPWPHLVAYTVTVDADLGAVYLIEHRRARRWLAPGGHVRAGESPEHAARRKLAEELGVELALLDGLSSNPLFVTLTDTVGLNSHLDVCLWYVFAASVTTGLEWDRRQASASRWWTFGEIRSAHPALLDPSVVRFIAKLEAELA
jgi:8-oxo-dGTP diphosphatase